MDTDRDIIVEDVEDNDIGVLPSTTSTTTVSEGREPLSKLKLQIDQILFLYFSTRRVYR